MARYSSVFNRFNDPVETLISELQHRCSLRSIIKMLGIEEIEREIRLMKMEQLNNKGGN